MLAPCLPTRCLSHVCARACARLFHVCLLVCLPFGLDATGASPKNDVLLGWPTDSGSLFAGFDCPDQTQDQPGPAGGTEGFDCPDQAQDQPMWPAGETVRGTNGSNSNDNDDIIRDGEEIKKSDDSHRRDSAVWAKDMRTDPAGSVAGVAGVASVSSKSNLSESVLELDWSQDCPLGPGLHRVSLSPREFLLGALHSGGRDEGLPTV